MSFMKEMILPLLVIGIFVCCCCCASQDSQLDIDETQDAFLKALSTRYGKRPSGHSFVRFGKRADTKGHSYMYFGKRSVPADPNFADLLQYIQRSQEPSWKRGHSIMRFGKRSDRHNFIRFGKRDTTDVAPDNEDDIESDKRDRHSMMYFGKRGGHSMLYFGKRMPYSDDEYEKRGGHSMMYFGKRSQSTDDDYDKRGPGGHSMMYFGKRLSLTDDDFDKRGQNGHSMMYFGKRSPLSDEDYEKKGGQTGHSMMYFGKRSSLTDDDFEKKGHSMMYFGKRLSYDDKDNKKGGHSMMYFGKREPYAYDNTDRYSGEDFSMEANKRGPHSMIHFGKRYDVEEANTGEENLNDKRAHSMIHFGKRSDDNEDALSNFTNDDEKKAGHGMIHFGKRQDDPYSVTHNDWNHAMGPYDLKNSHYSNLFKSDDTINTQKRDNKKSHMMIHFGKRSVENDKIPDEANSLNQKDADKLKLQPTDDEQKKLGELSDQKIRSKREVEPSDAPLLSFSPFITTYEGMEPSEENYSDYGYEFPLGPNSVVPVRNIRSNGSPEKSKNVFLRFGKR